MEGISLQGQIYIQLEVQPRRANADLARVTLLQQMLSHFDATNFHQDTILQVLASQVFIFNRFSYTNATKKLELLA